MEWGKSKHTTLDMATVRQDRILGAVDRAVTKKVLDLNAANRVADKIEMDQAMISNRTGLRDSLAALKEKARVAREKSLATSDKLTEAFAHQQRVTESLEQYADDVLKESNEVLAELGQFSNGGPA